MCQSLCGVLLFVGFQVPENQHNKKPKHRLTDLLVKHRFTNKACGGICGFLVPMNFGLTANAQAMLFGANSIIFIKKSGRRVADTSFPWLHKGLCLRLCSPFPAYRFHKSFTFVRYVGHVPYRHEIYNIEK